MNMNQNNIPQFDMEKNWAGIQGRVKRQFYKQVSIVATVIIVSVGGYATFFQQTTSKLYNQEAFEKILTMEEQLENELNNLQSEVVEIKENPRYFALIEQVNNINIRLEECKLQMIQNPRNPNFHRVYLTLLKTKRNALEILNEMKG